MLNYVLGNELQCFQRSSPTHIKSHGSSHSSSSPSSHRPPRAHIQLDLQPPTNSSQANLNADTTEHCYPGRSTSSSNIMSKPDRNNDTGKPNRPARDQHHEGETQCIGINVKKARCGNWISRGDQCHEYHPNGYDFRWRGT
jgi:hypothetical protein